MTFLRNAWYVAAHADEMAKTPLGRTILAEPMVMYRSEKGDPVALGDNCPHRFAPLHRGRVVGDNIQCPYHGLQFDRTGACVVVPTGGDPPPRARVKRYPLVERFGLIWVWMGDEEAADPKRVPDLSDIQDPSCGWFWVRLHAKANYQLLVDNLLDLTHTEFLHPFLASDGWAARNVSTCGQDGGAIIIRNVAENDNILPIMAAFKPHLNPIGKTVQVERWIAPSIIRLDVDYFTDNGEFLIPSAHFLTPETNASTHYFVVGGQSVDPACADLTEQMRVGVANVFSSEDIPMIEAQQAYLADADLMQHKPAILNTDSGAIQARRHLAKLIREESRSDQGKA